MYKIIRSKRKTIAIKVCDDGSVIIKAPRFASKAQIYSFINTKTDWIEKTQKKVKERGARLATVGKLTEIELKELVAAAKEHIPERVAYFAPAVGVKYGKITIRKQRSRWGSCSSAGNLSFNALLMLTPTEVLDGVVVHELCHIKQMNHSAAFYREVSRILPDYKERNKWLKENGHTLLERLPNQ